LKLTNRILDLLGRTSSKSKIDEPPLVAPPLVTVIPRLYTDPSVSIQCRRIIVKCAAANRQLYEVWAVEIASLITRKDVHQEMWATLWRYVALLPLEVTAGIIRSI
jgi:hypothetical protein